MPEVRAQDGGWRQLSSVLERDEVMTEIKGPEQERVDALADVLMGLHGKRDLPVTQYAAAILAALTGLGWSVERVTLREAAQAFVAMLEGTNVQNGETLALIAAVKGDGDARRVPVPPTEPTAALRTTLDAELAEAQEWCRQRSYDVPLFALAHARAALASQADDPSEWPECPKCGSTAKLHKPGCTYVARPLPQADDPSVITQDELARALFAVRWYGHTYREDGALEQSQKEMARRVFQAVAEARQKGV